MWGTKCPTCWPRHCAFAELVLTEQKIEYVPADYSHNAPSSTCWKAASAFSYLTIDARPGLINPALSTVIRKRLELAFKEKEYYCV